MGTITAPELLTVSHTLEGFDSGNETLNNWLQKRALKNQLGDASRTFVITDGRRVIAYYSLGSGSIERTGAPKPMARNMPNAIPVMILGRLAVDHRYQSKKLGSALLKDALLRTKRVSKEVGIKAMLVHAISDEAKRFYSQYGFQTSVMDDMTLMLSIKHI